jgi:uncharacterized protein with FMN-binding domain
MFVMNKININNSNIVIILAVLILVFLYVAGIKREHRIMENLITDFYPDLEGNIPLQSDPVIYEFEKPDSKDTNYRVFASGFGWGGPFTIMTEVDKNALIIDVKVIQHCETPSYINRLENHKFFKQFVNMETTSAFKLNEDIDVVSGATISSVGFSDAMRSGSHIISSNIFGKANKTYYKSFSIGVKEISILLLFVVVLIASLFKLKKLRLFTLFAGMLIIGFIYNVPVSISQFSSIFLGYIPSPLINITWWLIIGGALLLIIFSGKNLYCSWMCPFGAVQEFISKFSGFKLPMNSKVQKYGSKILYGFTFLVVCLMLYFRNTSSGNYEPFAALFKFDGYGLIWFILPIIMFSSFFWKRFYCRFFCPAGAALTIVAKLRNKTVFKVKCMYKNIKNEKREIK